MADDGSNSPPERLRKHSSKRKSFGLSSKSHVKKLSLSEVVMTVDGMDIETHSARIRRELKEAEEAAEKLKSERSSEVAEEETDQRTGSKPFQITDKTSKFFGLEDIAESAKRGSKSDMIQRRASKRKSGFSRNSIKIGLTTSPSSSSPELKSIPSSPRGAQDGDPIHSAFDKNRKVLPSGTIEDLAQSFADNHDVATVRNAILAHRHFFPSYELMGALINVFDKLDGAKAEKFANVFKLWIRWDHTGLLTDSRASSLFYTMLNGLEKTNAQLYDTLQKSLEKKIREDESEERERARDPMGVSGDNASFLSINPLDYDAEDFAKQICIYEHKLLRRIPLSEFYGTSWTRNKAPHIEAFIDYVNKLSHSFVYLILSQKTHELRVSVLSKLVLIGVSLVELQSYNAVLAIFLALQNNSVDKFWEENRKLFSQRVSRGYKEILDLMSPMLNFGNYRAVLTKVIGPFLPCFEVHLRDLLYATDGNENYTDREKRIFNLFKVDTMGKSISVFAHAMAMPYAFQENRSIQGLLSTVRVPSLADIEALIRNPRAPRSLWGSLHEAANHTFDFSAMPEDPAKKEEFLRNMAEDLKSYAHFLVARAKELEAMAKLEKDDK